MVLKWLKSLFSKKPEEPEKITVHFVLPDGKEFGVEALRLAYHSESKCKIHWEYQGVAVPTNNCNQCWEYYAKKMKKT